MTEGKVEMSPRGCNGPDSVEFEFISSSTYQVGTLGWYIGGTKRVEPSQPQLTVAVLLADRVCRSTNMPGAVPGVAGVLRQRPCPPVTSALPAPSLGRRACGGAHLR